MKLFKLVWMLLGCAWLVALFLPYGGERSVWDLGQLAQQAGSGTGLALVLTVAALALAWLLLSATAFRRRLSRPIALAAAVAAVGILISLFSLGRPGGEMGIAGPILIHGSLLGFLAAIVALIRPERASPAL